MLDHEFNAARSISVRLITLDLNLILGLITKGVIRNEKRQREDAEKKTYKARKAKKN